MVYKHVESTNNTQLTLKALEIDAASKKFFLFGIRKNWSLIKIQIVIHLDKKLRKLIAIFYNTIFFFLEKKFEMMLHLVVAFKEYQIYWLR